MMISPPTEAELRACVEFAKGDALDFPQTDAKYQAFALDRVRRVIRSLHEPTEGMLEAARDSADYDYSYRPGEVWSAMIDAASPPERPT